jgi:hypothetical protein
MFFAVAGRPGASHRNNNVAAIAPENSARTKSGTSVGRIPANVSDNERAMLTAGFANAVDEVNQYADVIYAPTANGTISVRRREHPQVTQSKPKVARNSLMT